MATVMEFKKSAVIKKGFKDLMTGRKTSFGLSGNALKILAALFMLIDHIGFLLCPGVLVLRQIGRLSLPLFAFTFAEGCTYTKNKALHFSMLASLAVVCQIAYFIAEGSTYGSILVTFCFSAAMIYAMQYFKKTLFDRQAMIIEKIFSGLLFASSVLVIYFVCTIYRTDYGFFGAMLPVFVSLVDFNGLEAPRFLKAIDCKWSKMLLLMTGLLLLAYLGGPELGTETQLISLAALGILVFYNGTRGRYKMKYFFYVFYPLHLVILDGIYMLMTL